MDVCPNCGDVGEPLREAASGRTLKCIDCQHVWTLPPKRVRKKELQMVLSDADSSWADRMWLEADEVVAVGEEFDWDESRFLVTGLEIAGGTAKKAKAEDVTVLHAKRFDTVVLKIAVNEAEKTTSYQLDVVPEHPVTIGEVLEVQGRKVVVKTIKSDLNRTLHRGGLLARNIRRVFCDVAPAKAKVGQIIKTRIRGRPAEGVKGKADPRRKRP